MVMHALSIPLTILAAMERFHLFPAFSSPRPIKKLLIHLVGARIEYEHAAGALAIEEVSVIFECGCEAGARAEPC